MINQINLRTIEQQITSLEKQLRWTLDLLLAPEEGSTQNSVSWKENYDAAKPLASELKAALAVLDEARAQLIRVAINEDIIKIDSLFNYD